ncbi:MAG: arsenic efflux protein, partial [Ignavibacteria bacterium]|nr:arsenic efflux protein [Ignavibacteria bacterium]
SLFLSKRISIGTLIATYIATSDEALPVFLAYGNQYVNILHLVIAKFIGGIAFGYLIDFLLTKKIYDGPERVAFSSKVVEVKNELERTKYWEIIKHSLERTLRIYLWVLSITLLIGLILFLFDLKEIILKTSIHPIIQIIITGIVGLIPNCGASIAIAQAYLLAGLSFSATVAGLSAGAGYGPIVLIKDGEWKTSIKLLGICLSSSILLGVLIYLFLKV